MEDRSAYLIRHVFLPHSVPPPLNTYLKTYLVQHLPYLAHSPRSACLIENLSQHLSHSAPPLKTYLKTYLKVYLT